mmetsp:Transcript_17034/g.35385  ORF Transcript_17034/g.35385 Transcript_17034/m.35385 type:complete len:102 (-) Transcript_17034:3-308(-)
MRVLFHKVNHHMGSNESCPTRQKNILRNIFPKTPHERPYPTCTFLIRNHKQRAEVKLDQRQTRQKQGQNIRKKTKKKKMDDDDDDNDDDNDSKKKKKKKKM